MKALDAKAHRGGPLSMMPRIDSSFSPPRGLILALLVLPLAFGLTPHVLSQAAKETEAEVETRVEVSTLTPDEGIRQRIVDIFSQVGDFENIGVKVNAGVVTLSGEVPGARAREEAIALARRTEGVVLTLDRLTETTQVSARLSPAMAKLHHLGNSFMINLPLIAIALIVVVFSVVLGNFLHRRAKWYARLRLSTLASELVRRLVRARGSGNEFSILQNLTMQQRSTSTGPTPEHRTPSDSEHSVKRERKE